MNAGMRPGTTHAVSPGQRPRQRFAASRTMNEGVIEVGMLGPTGAGKTSLVTSLYAQFPDVTRDLGLILRAQDGLTSRILDRWRSDLERISREIVVREQGIPNTREKRDLTFSLYRAGNGRDEPDRARLTFRFTDYPGGWLFEPTSADGEEATLRARLRGSPFLFLAIDTPALLADGRTLAPRVQRSARRARSRPGLAGRPRAAHARPRPAQVRAVVRSDDDVARLVKTVAEAYGHVLDPAARRELTSVHVCPVQTVGSLVFDRFETAQNTPVSRYRGRSIGGGYAPRWTAEPLRLLVAGLLDEHLRARSWWEKVLEVFGRDADLRQALAVLATQSYGPSQRVV